MRLFSPVASSNYSSRSRRSSRSVDLFLAEITGALPGISCGIQHVDILPHFVVTLALNRHLLNQRVCILFSKLVNMTQKENPKNPNVALTTSFDWCCHPVDTIFAVLGFPHYNSFQSANALIHTSIASYTHCFLSFFFSSCPAARNLSAFSCQI